MNRKILSDIVDDLRIARDTRGIVVYLEGKTDLPILLATGYAELPEGSSLDLPRLAKPYQQNQLAAEVAKLVRHERQLAASR